MGYVAKIMGTAPRRPTHETKIRARRLKLRNGSRPKNTASGRATNIRNRATAPPRINTSGRISSSELTSNPMVMNMTICASHVNPSMKVVRLPRWAIL